MEPRNSLERWGEQVSDTLGEHTRTIANLVNRMLELEKKVKELEKDRV